MSAVHAGTLSGRGYGTTELQLKDAKSICRWGSGLEFGLDPGPDSSSVGRRLVQAMDAAESPSRPGPFESKCSNAVFSYVR